MVLLIEDTVTYLSLKFQRWDTSENHYDFNKTIHIIPKNYSSGKFDVMLEKGLAEISEVATKLVTKQC